ncbi:MAG: DUF4097 family beta strand repeat protein [Firmicutes bacterium]|nr:DUF4097 family beta strand repeat protein [Bacillota bacterium]
MKKATMVWLIVGTVLILSGAVLFTAAMSAADWNFNTLSNSEYKTVSHDITDEFQNIEIDISTADITILPADTEKAEVICYEEKKTGYTVAVQNGTLFITEKDDREWYDHFGFGSFEIPKITVYLPQDSYNSLSVETSTGDINLTDITCNKIVIESNTGDTTLENVIAIKTFDLKCDTGDIEFTLCDAAEIFAETDTGNIYGTLLTEKIIFAQSDTGDIRVPQSMNGGRCELSTDTGDITIEIR